MTLWNKYTYGSTVLVELSRLFGLSIHIQLVGLLEREISQSQGRYLHTEQHRDIHASSGIRTHDPVLERAKTIHALDRAATVIVCESDSLLKDIIIVLIYATDHSLVNKYVDCIVLYMSELLNGFSKILHRAKVTL
jgi:hypothetical protein